MAGLPWRSVPIGGSRPAPIRFCTVPIGRLRAAAIGSLGAAPPGRLSGGGGPRPGRGGLRGGGAAMRQQAGLALATGPAAKPQPGIARSVQGPALDMARCGALVRELIDTICAHRQYLSEI